MNLEEAIKRVERAEEKLGRELNALAGKSGGAWDLVDCITELINAKMQAFALDGDSHG